jgi:hypothetical protein
MGAESFASLAERILQRPPLLGPVRLMTEE